jgi:hypothetical protein
VVDVVIKRDAQPLSDPDERGATLWLGLGLGALGFVLGFTTALSVHEGISSALLAGMFSFVAGTLLTFAGFRFMKGGRLLVSSRRAGIGVFTFAIGVLLGEPAGIAVRAFGTEWLQTIGAPPPRTANTAMLHRDTESAAVAAKCTKIGERLESDYRDRKEREFDDLRFLWERSDCRPARL